MEDTALVSDRYGEDYSHTSPARHQRAWLDEMRYFQSRPRGYQQTVALLLGWDPDGDDPGVTEEVRTH